MLFRETSPFSRQRDALFGAESFRGLQLALLERPDLGAVLPGGGGLRKVRWAMEGTGKKGGQDDMSKAQRAALRALVEREFGSHDHHGQPPGAPDARDTRHPESRHGPMPTAKKNAGRSRGRPTARPATAKATKAAPRTRVQGGKGMDPALFAELLESVREGGRIFRGEQEAARSVTAEEIRAAAAADRQRDEVPDAGAIRERLGLSQALFADLLGISRRTLEGWEQGRREPEGPARVLLRVAATHPEALLATRRRAV